MRRYVCLVALVALATLVFAPAALAQQMGDDMMMEDEMMMEETMMSSASAMGDDMMSASAMGEEEMMSSASASASALPGTGGTPILPLISAAALVLIVGSGMLAATLVRRNS
jgi:hypothetical protein